MSRVPVLVILGSTGTGKSRLGIELARRFSGEIISADSMQVYKGLDIITAKVTKEEREMVPHHMIDIVNPGKWYRVSMFRNAVLPIMDDVMARKKMPIIVGGTNYYIESILWKILIPNPRDDPSYIESKTVDQTDEASDDEYEDVEEENSYTRRMYRLDSESNEELHKKLSEVDPEMAKRLHPNNRRKVIRSLEVFEQHGVKHSELLKAQRSAGGSGLGGPLRYLNSIILWLRCDMGVLNQRLDCRVDAMLERGLLQELLDFHRRYIENQIKTGAEPDYTIGFLQSIGFKQLHPYLTLPEEERSTEEGQKLLKKGIEDLRIVTKRYARKQDRWVLNRMVRRTDRQVPPIYTLDCTDLEQWDDRVLKPAEEIISALIRGEEPEQKPFKVSDEIGKLTDSSTEETHYCQICDKILVGEFQWNVHIKGTKHRRMIQKKAILAEKEVSAKSQSQSVE